MKDHVQVPESVYRRLMWTSSVIEHSDQIALITDADGYIVYATPACERIFGLNTERLLATTFEALFDLTDGQRQQLAGDIAQGRPCDIEAAARRENGTTFPVRLFALPIEGSLGTQRILFLASDITGQRRAEKARQAAEEKLQLVFENTFTGISLYEEYADGSRTLVDCNERYVEMSGRSKQELLEMGNTLPVQRSLIIDESRESYLEALRTGEPYRGRFSWLRPDGKDNVVEFSATAVQIGDRTLTIGFDRDITERVRAEEALRASEEKYRQLVENANDAILVAQDGYLKFFNPKTIEITGYSREQLASMPFHELIHPDDRQTVTERHVRRLQGEEVPHIYHFRIVDAGGRTRWIEINAILISWEGRPATLNLCSDITERVRAARALHAKTRQQDQLIETARHLAASLDLKEVLGQIGVGAKAILQAHSCTIYLLEADGKTLSPVIAIDPDYEQELLAAPLGIDNSLTGQSVKAKQGLIFGDAGNNPLGYHIPGTLVDEHEHIIATPFIADDRVLGAMCLNRKDVIFLEEDLALAETFAAYAATALKNAQVHAALRHEVEERRRTEAVLAESEERYRSTINAIVDLVHVVDTDLRIVLWNQAIEARLEELGYDVDPLGKDLLEVFPFLRPKVCQEYQRVVDSGEPLLTEETTQIGTEEYWTETSKIPILDNQGRVYRIVTVIHDVTEQKRMEQALLHRLAMEELVSDISTRFIQVSSDELDAAIRHTLHALGEFADVDRCYLHLFSDDLRRLEQVYEWSAEGIESREHKITGQVIEDMQWALAKEQKLDVVYIPRVADLPPEALAEKEGWTTEGIKSILSIPIAREGAPIGVLGFNTLHSERQWSQEDIRLLSLVGDILSNVFSRQQAQEEKVELENRLERARLMESLGLLAGGVAHDLNNLLGPLVAYPELILLDLPADSPSREDVVRIQEAAEKAASVVQDLLTLARRGAYRMSSLYLNTLVKEYLRSPSFAELQSRYPAVSVETRLDQELLPVSGSAPHLSKVVMNLVTNAFEAMPEGGRLTISTSCESLDRPLDGYERVEAGDYVVLRVGDTGTGISDQDRPWIFEPFYTKKEMGRSGSGLGLSVVQGVVQDHRGKIDLQTGVGEGTTFLIYLPITDQALDETIQEQLDYRGDEAVLVVDDLEAQRKLAARVLSSLGYHVSVVESGREAVHYLQENEADILVLDMIMEDDFDGLDAYQAIAQIHPGQKAVIASGFSETERVKEAQRLGAGQFVKKPYTLNGLGKAVREELDRS
jgi:PAS domain S-box-containing protein